MSDDDKTQPPEFFGAPQVVSQYELPEADQKVGEAPIGMALTAAKGVFYDDREVYGY